MLKARTGEVLPPINKDFEKRVLSLANDGRHLAVSYADLTARMINFARQFHSLSQKAKELDKGSDSQHLAFLLDQMAEAVKTERKDVWSKWNKIGSASAELLKFKDSIPPQRECLYELAIAIAEKKPIERWISTNALSLESTVREVAALRRTKRRAKRERQYAAKVTLAFESFEDAAECLRTVVVSSIDTRIRSDRAFFEALKAKLDPDAYEKAISRASAK